MENNLSGLTAAAEQRRRDVLQMVAQWMNDPDVVKKIDDTLRALYHARQAAAIIHDIDKPCPVMRANGYVMTRGGQMVPRF